MDLEISLDELRRITNDFSEDKMVGRGGYGEVYKAEYRGQQIAVKLLHTREGIDNNQLKNELINHMKVQHPNIVRLVGYCNGRRSTIVKQNDGDVFGIHIYRVLCFEYMSGGSLDKRIFGEEENSLGNKNWETHYKIIKGICEGFHYLHCRKDQPILHLDLKPANILLDKDMTPKLADFGLSRIFTASHSCVQVTSAAGTLKYMAPEFKYKREMSKMTDIFSLGVTILDVIKGSHNFDHDHDVETTNFIKNVNKHWKNRDKTAHLYQVDTCTEIAIQCTDSNSKKRPTIMQIVADLNNTETKVSIQGPHAQDSSSSSSPTVAGRRPVDVVIVYAFDCTDNTAAWYTVNDVFWLVQEKLLAHHFVDSRMGYIYVRLASNTFRSDMKLVDSADTQETGYTTFALRTANCTKNMASGLAEAHKMLTDRRHRNGTILLFSDGLVHKGDFFDGAENFVSEAPVHTFTLGGDAYNQGLHAIATNSASGMFHSAPVPERPSLSASFLKLLDIILDATTTSDDEKSPTPSSEWEPLDVVIVYAFDCTHSTPAWHTMNDVFWLVQEKLTHFVDACLGYIYFTLAGNTYTSDMKLVDSGETKETGYSTFAQHTIPCTKNMASGLDVAHKMTSNRGYKNSIILFFSDGLIHKAEFFDGAESFISILKTACPHVYSRRERK